VTGYHKLAIAFVVPFMLAACASTAPEQHPVAGTWDITSVSQRGETQQVWTFNEDLTGTLQGARGAPQAIDATLAGDRLTFDLDLNLGGRSITIQFAGTVEGDTLTGELSSRFGTSTVTGQRRSG